MRHFATAALASLMLFSFATASALEKAVTIKGSITSDAAKLNHFTVTVQVDIASGWHIYDEVGEGTEVATSLKLKSLEGVSGIGDWNRPNSTDGSAVNSLVYEGQVSFQKVLPSNRVPMAKTSTSSFRIKLAQRNCAIDRKTRPLVSRFLKNSLLVKASSKILLCST